MNPNVMMNTIGCRPYTSSVEWTAISTPDEITRANGITGVRMLVPWKEQKKRQCH